MNTAERQIEDLARTVTCPVCGARRGKRCRYTQTRFITSSQYSHTGRLNKARGQT